MKYLFLLILPLVCLASEPKFHFMDCVSVTKGFYKGCKGKVTDLLYTSSYEVNVQECKGYSFSTQFEENELKLAKGCAQ